MIVYLVILELANNVNTQKDFYGDDMYGLDFFENFKIDSMKVISNSTKVHYCSVCGETIGRRKVRITGYPHKSEEFKKAFFCANAKCWGNAARISMKEE